MTSKRIIFYVKLSELMKTSIECRTIQNVTSRKKKQAQLLKKKKQPISIDNRRLKRCDISKIDDCEVLVIQKSVTSVRQMNCLKFLKRQILASDTNGQEVSKLTEEKETFIFWYRISCKLLLCEFHIVVILN